MHLVMILIALVLAWGMRLLAPCINGVNRWQRSLFLFLLPPLLILMTAIAVVCMGYRGEMLGLQASWFSYGLAVGFLLIGIILLLQLAYQGFLSLQQIKNYPQSVIFGERARIIHTDFPYSAKVGFCQPELVISQGLINTLSPEHLQAVLAHEKAHEDYYDTFWFFWLSWFKSMTFWLPYTEILWQDLLFLREIRADQKAAQSVDPLLLAESLLIIAQEVNQFNPIILEQSLCAAFHNSIPKSHLVARIDALFSENKPSFTANDWSWSGLLLCLLPLMTVPLHC